MKYFRIASFALLSMLALTGCSSDGDDSNNLLEQEVDPSTRTGESAFMKTFVGNYWDVVEY